MIRESIYVSESRSRPSLSFLLLFSGLPERSFFGRSGDTVSLHPENRLSEGIADVRWIYNDTCVCSHKKGHALCIEGYNVFSNGTLTLNASKSRGGTYTLDMFDEDGRSIPNPTITLRVLGKYIWDFLLWNSFIILLQITLSLITDSNQNFWVTRKVNLL